jgi:hypothetical protein
MIHDAPSTVEGLAFVGLSKLLDQLEAIRTKQVLDRDLVSV